MADMTVRLPFDQVWRIRYGGTGLCLLAVPRTRRHRSKPVFLHWKTWLQVGTRGLFCQARGDLYGDGELHANCTRKAQRLEKHSRVKKHNVKQGWRNDDADDEQLRMLLIFVLLATYTRQHLWCLSLPILVISMMFFSLWLFPTTLIFLFSREASAGPLLKHKDVEPSQF